MDDVFEPTTDDSLTAIKAGARLMDVMADNSEELKERFPSRLDAFLDGVSVGKRLARSGE